jgi:hypothetical protein
MKRITISAFAFLMIYLSTFGQESLTFLRNWNTYDIPTNLIGYNSSKNDWFLYLDKDEIRVIDYRLNRSERKLFTKELPFKIEQSGQISFVQVHDGYLVGINKGEWGGGLYWYSKDGKENIEIFGSIFSSPVIQFIKRDGKIFAITGLSHMGISCGNIIKIEKIEKKWIIEEYLKLPEAPCAIKLDHKENMLVFTTSGLYSIDKDANIETLSKKLLPQIIPVIEVELSSKTYSYKQKPLVEQPMGVWAYLYPTSMVIQKRVVYVGMRGGVYKFDTSTKKEEWLMPE